MDPSRKKLNMSQTQIQNLKTTGPVRLEKQRKRKCQQKEANER